MFITQVLLGAPPDEARRTIEVRRPDLPLDPAIRSKIVDDRFGRQQVFITVYQLAAVVPLKVWFYEPSGTMTFDEFRAWLAKVYPRPQKAAR